MTDILRINLFTKKNIYSLKHQKCFDNYLYFAGEEKIIRECENNLMKSAYHRLRMPVLRRHGYCEPSRKNDFWNPTETTDSNMMYCFCNDWNGCNSANSLFGKVIPVISLCFSILFIARRVIFWTLFSSWQSYFCLFSMSEFW
jgi:hypothetical protein